MKAAVLRNVGDETLDVVDDMEVTDPGPGEVTVKIEATGVCHSDLSGMNGTIPTGTPVVLGHEGAGIVERVGEGVTDVAVGDHVIVAWSPPCGRCVNCAARKSPHLCMEVQMASLFANRFVENGNPVSGFAGTGTFAERATLPVQAAIKIDDDVPFEVASLIGCGVTTGVGAAINTAKVTPGSSVVVFGCGGVGIAAIQGARIAGAAEIVAVDLVDRKLDDAKRFGATHSCKPEELDSLKATLTGGEGFDYSFEAIGLPSTMRASYDAIRRGGTACIVGVGKLDEFVQFSAFELFFSEKNLVGSYYGSADVRTDFHKLLGFYKDGSLPLADMITRRIKLDDINDAFDAMQRGEVIRQVISF